MTCASSIGFVSAPVPAEAPSKGRKSAGPKLGEARGAAAAAAKAAAVAIGLRKGGEHACILLTLPACTCAVCPRPVVCALPQPCRSLTVTLPPECRGCCCKSEQANL